MPPNQTNPYTLHTTLEPNRIYSCFGIKLKVKEEVDTFSNSGNFEIHINNINLQELESKGKGITKDTPIFCNNFKNPNHKDLPNAPSPIRNR